MHVTLETALCLAVLIIACHACQKGHVWKHKGALICDECDSGTFMPEDNNTKSECYPCTELKDNTTEVLIKGCSKEEDAVVICKPGLGLFRINNICKDCAVCEDGYELQACNGDRNTVCCGSDETYVDINSDGVKVCAARTMPCRQGQFFVSKDTCEPCPTGTYMVENHHNNTACNPCQQVLQINTYIAMACNISCNRSFIGNGQKELALDTTSFNCSHLPYDLNKTGNTTDQKHTASSGAVYEVVKVLAILGTVGIIAMLLLVFVKHVAGTSKLLLSVMDWLSDNQQILDVCMFLMFILLVATLIAQIVDPALIIVTSIQSFCNFVLIALVIVNMLQRQHLFQRPGRGYALP